MSERFRCSVRSLQLGEPCYGTASQVRRWILVEQPGPWGRDAVVESRLPIDVATRLRALARMAGARLLLIRRHGRSAPGRRVCFAATTTADVQRIERLDFDDPAELLAVDWARLRAGDDLGGQAVEQPLYLVCTNGSHDTCCAEFGRPVARTLDAVLGDRVWECSHFGGDRFAGNLLCLPDGIYYGRVTPDAAPQLVREHEAGLLDLARYRGRSWQPFVAQAAEFFIREQQGIRDIHGVVPRAVEDLGDGQFRVTLSSPHGLDVTATVACSEAIDPQQLTCHSGREEHPPRYRLVAID
jgi:hypothetical protein